MRNLGKIFLLVTLLTNIVYANVVASIEPQTVYFGDTVTYNLTISGDDIKKPVITDICGNDITATGSQTTLQAINGEYKKSYRLSYEFTPTKSCTIEPTAVEVASKIEKSNSVELEVKPRAKDIDADFVLSLKASKKELYVGEPFTLTLEIKQKDSARVVDNKFEMPEFQGFWQKSDPVTTRGRGSGYSITKIEYRLSPQREGNLTIEPAKLKIASRAGVNSWSSFMPQVKWRSYFSNALHFQVKPLPNNAKIIGNFTISASAQKREVNPNEPVNVVVTLKGSGNLEDVESFKPYVADVNVFDEKIVIQGDTLTQKLVFVGEKDFTIPSFELVFFNTKTAQVEKIKTEPIEVKVSGDAIKSAVEIKRDKATEVVVPKEVAVVKTKVEVKNNYLLVALAFVVGLGLGIVLMRIDFSEISKKTNKLNLKDEKLLLIKLLPYKDRDSDVFHIVELLEYNIYAEDKKLLDKKLLKDILKRYSIS